MPRRRIPAARRGLATLAVLAAGAAGGAGATVLIEGGGTATASPTAAATATPAARAAVATNAADALTVGQIYRRAKLGVVDITAVSSGSGGAGVDGSPSPFGPPQASSGGTATGTGIVYDARGHIVTNQHVVAGASSIQVRFSDGTTAKATVVGEDASSDVAVLRVDVPAAELQPLAFGDSSAVQVGDPVVAIGSPYGLSETVTSGVVSALNRTIDAPDDYSITGAIQTDASINPGNSGGPLFDAAGQVIGINAQIESSSGTNAGIGFAIPSATVRRVADQLIAGHSVAHPYLGMTLGDGTGGATVGQVRSGSPAAAAGLRSGDVITAFDGVATGSADAVVGALQAHAPGDRVTLTYSRDGATRKASVTVGSRSGDPAASSAATQQ
jgi:putative serine protease PepD